ncbi:MAG: helix-turn-helix transcriptional regulator [Epulopiscium sp.]|nr:helix-turn-helix transcriptional regulator [Candidatus Epulonipiscium sp.]
MSKEYVAKVLKEKRREAGYSVKDISEIFQKSIKTIYSWENGQGQPDADTLISLCYLYGIKSFDELDETKREQLSGVYPEEIAKLAFYYNKLNKIGKQEALKRLEELTYIERYSLGEALEAEQPSEYHFRAKLSARDGKTTVISGETELSPEEIHEMMEKAAKKSKNLEL